MKRIVFLPILLSCAYAAPSLDLLSAEDFIQNKELEKIDNSLKNAYANPIADLSLFNNDSTRFKSLFVPQSLIVKYSDNDIKEALSISRPYLEAEKKFQEAIAKKKEDDKKRIVIKSDETKTKDKSNKSKTNKKSD